MANLFNKNKEHRGIMPIGDGEQLALSAQTMVPTISHIASTILLPWFWWQNVLMHSMGAYYFQSRPMYPATITTVVI